MKCSVLADAVKKVLNEDGVHEGERNYHRYLSCIRVSPEHITICLKYKILSKGNLVDDGLILKIIKERKK